MNRSLSALACLAALCLLVSPLFAQKPAAKKEAKKAPPKKPAAPKLEYPPQLTGGKTTATVSGPELLKPTTDTLEPGVTIAKTPPTVTFTFFPGQDYEARPWSNWGDSVFANGKYYCAIGDHLAPMGNAYTYEYDPATKQLRMLTNVAKLLKLPEGHYAPGKIHTRLGMGSDGWLYFATHRGSTTITRPENHFSGEWILRVNPASGKSEIVAHAPIPNHCIPNGQLDPDRMIYYGGTAPGQGDASGIIFFAYDLKNRKLLYASQPGEGPSRAMVLSTSTGRLYFTPRTEDSPLMRYDPSSGKPPEEIPGSMSVRASTDETPQGIVYVASYRKTGEDVTLSAFDVKSEKITLLGPAQVGVNHYIASVKADPTGRYLYYVPGAHGGAEKDGSPVVQYDTKTRQRKILCFLHPAFEKHGIILKGTYAVSVDDKGEKLFVTWNVSRESKNWDCCGLTVIDIPASERE